MYSTGYCCQIFIKNEFSQHVVEKSLNIKHHVNPSSAMDRHDAASSRFSQFCERA